MTVPDGYFTFVAWNVFRKLKLKGTLAVLAVLHCTCADQFLANHEMDVLMCAFVVVADESSTLVEKMVFRKSKPFCTNSSADPQLCKGDAGARRLIFDPRKVVLMGAHAVHFPKAQGLDLSTSILVMNKFVVSPGRK